jgi:hypothetical protein
MLRMVFLSVLIALGVGLTMELRTPPRSAVAVAQPVAETTVGISDSPDASAKGDRLEITAASSELPAQPALVDEGIPSEGITTGSSKPPTMIRSKKVAAARPKSKPKATNIKRTTISDRKGASDTEPCRLSAFGGLRKALNTVDCAI